MVLAAIAAMAFGGFAAESALATYGQIIVKKVNVGGPVNDLFKFDVSSDMKATGVPVPAFSGTQFTLKGGATQTFGTSFECNVGGSAAGCGPARTYTVTEAAASQPAGYLLTGLACTTTNGSTDSDSTTNLATGVSNIKISHLEVVTCTYTNTYQYATLRVIKQVVNDNGGNAGASAFSLHVKKNGADVSNSPALGSTTGTDYFIPVGTYTVSEDAAAGYAMTGISGACSAQGTVTLAPGELKTCTVTNNDQAAHLTVIKHVVNDNGGTAAASAFQMDVTAASPSSAHFAGSEAGNTVTVNPGAYSVDESGGPSGYTKSLSASCSGTIAIGQDKTCTITNNDQAAHLTVVKHVVNDDGGTAAASAFQMDVTAVSPSSAHFAGSEGGDTITVNLGAYSVDESGGPSGYTKSASAGCSGTIAIGQDKTCTITNNDQASHVTVIKHVVNDDGGTAAASAFQMDVTAVSPSSAHFAGSEAGNTITVNPGAYSVDESGGPSGYAKSSSAGCSGTIAIGQDKTCSITNNDQAAHLTVIKHVVNDDGGTAAASAFQMDVTAVSPSSAHFAGSEAGNTITVNPGAYSVDESGGPAGYTKSSSAGCAGSIAIGQDKTCTITNNDQAAHLTVVKHVVNDDGGTAAASAFQMDVTAVSPSSAHFAGSEAGNTISVNPGAYSVDESGGPSGYAKSASAGCAGTIAIGQDKTCTITNNDQAAHLTVIKHVVGGGNASAFNMVVTASHPSDASFAGAESPGHTITLDAGNYSATEGDHTHYTQDRSAGCEGSVALGQTKTCTITNTKMATVVVEKVTDPAQTGEERDSFGFHTTLPGEGTFNLVHGGTETREVVPGSYTVTEDDPRPAGYKLTGLTCTEDGANDSSTPAAGELASARVAAIVAQAGETVHCTFTNSQVTASIAVLKSGPDFAYHGDTLHFEFAVTNSGASPLHGVTVSDDKCADVSAEPIRRENDNGDSFLDHVGQDGQTPEKWVFDCSMPMPAHAADEANPLVNKATATGLDEYDRSVEAVDHHETDILHPAIKIAKGGPARANAGALVRYALVVTNPGDQPFADGLVKLTDAKCEAPPTLYSKNGDESPATLDPGDTWTYTCAVQTTVGQTSVHNIGIVTGTDSHEKVVTDTDSADTVLDQPASGVLGVTAKSAAVAGTARLRGPSGCAAKRTKAYITGKQIASVRFTLDGHRLATMSRPNSGNRYQVHITARSLRFGVHKVVARVKFVAASNTKAKTLRLAFQRCGHVARVRFTG